MDFLKMMLSKYNVKKYGFLNFSMDKMIFETRRNDTLNSSFKSIVIMAFPYYSKAAVGGNISMYASVNDYHVVLKNLLTPMIEELKQFYKDEEFLLFTDSSPIAEVKTAYQAGLGVIGRNSTLITKEYGSFVFLTSIITTLQLEESKFIGGECLSCNLCIKNCPAKAIVEYKKVDKNLCLSSVSQRKGELTEYEKNLLRENNIAWGCDICQRICPHNKDLKDTYMKEFRDGIITTLDEESVKIYKTRAFGFKGKAVLLRNIENLKNV